MPSITVNDHDGQQLLAVNLSEKSGLRRYLRAALGLRSFVPSRRDLGAALTDHADKGRDIDFAVERPIELDVVTLQLSAGGRVGVAVHGPEAVVIPGSDIRPAVLAPAGTAVMSCALRAVISAGAATPGATKLGFNAGTGLTLAYHHPFDLSGPEPTAGEALKTTLEAAVLPVDVEDLSRMAVGAIASTSGEGHIEVSGSATMSALANPLATPGLPLVGSLAVKASATVTVGARWRLSGLFERRVTKLSKTRARLEYFKLTKQGLTISAEASAGVSATLRDAELISMLMRAISSDPKADLVALVNAGLTDEQIEAMQRAIAFSVNRSLTLTAEAQLSIDRQRAALFSYDIDLGELTAETRAAVDDSLRGSLSKIEDGGAGITIGPSGALDLRKKSVRWRLNLFGVLNAASIATFVRTSTTLYDPATGGLQLADEVARSRIAVTTRPFEADTQKIRKVTFESLTVTAAYQASRLLPMDLALTAQHTYIEQRARTNRRDMADHFRAIVGLGLCSPADAAAALGETTEFGQSILVIDCQFDQTACDALFLDTSGSPHPETHFEQVGREAMLALIPPDDPERAHRRWPLERPAVWEAMKAAGADLTSVLPSHISRNAVRLGTVRDDFLTIVFWATAMRRASVALTEMRTLLRGRGAESLKDDKEFGKARRRLEQTLAAVVANTQSQFGDPWDALVLEAASGSTARLQALVVSAAVSKSFEAGEAAPERVMRGLVAEAPAARAIAWTDAQRQVFERHVVNLRKGELSGDGSFQSSKAQVEKIFSEHLPTALAAARARGDRLRIMFYAHGGLTDETGGLRMPLARNAFWTGNGVYPIYFVWETGLRETLADLLGGIVGRRPGLEGISDITDAAIERGARYGGRPIWGAMKDSAAKAVRSTGGAALVARLTAELWRAKSSHLELHAAGHSAGSIFHAYFLPLLTSQKVPAGTPAISVQSLHFLAPAASNALFKKQLMPIIGRNKPVNALTVYTMRDDVERKDPSVPAYGKSLLYLVRAALEDNPNTELVGLEISLKSDLDLIRFFGIGGRHAVADIVFSTTAQDAPLTSRSSSVEHGDFDNDEDTMNSVMRRILSVSDPTKIVDYHEEPVDMGAAEEMVFEGVAAPARRRRSATPAARSRRASRGAAPKKKWTLMVWMAGDNNLESFGTKDLLEMKRVGSSDDVDVLVQFDRQTDDRTRRYHVKAGGAIEDDVVEELGETNTGDPAVAVDFFRWGMQRFPSERVLTVLWNHGSGVDDKDVYARAVRGGGATRGAAQPVRAAVRTVAASRHRRALFSTTIDAALNDRAIAFDDTSRDFLDTLELKRVLLEASREAGRAVDLVGFDACLMNMVEIAHQLRGTTEFIVGSEDIEPGDGWPYDRVLEKLNANPSMDAQALGTVVVDAFVAAYSTGRITQSLLSVGRVGAVSTAVDALAKALLAAIKTPAEFVALSRAVNGAQRFRTVDFADLSDFCDQVRERTGVAAVKNAAKAVQQALAAPDGAVIHERHKGPDVARAGGAAIYLPAGEVATPYTKLDFAKQTAWRKLLDGLKAS